MSAVPPTFRAFVAEQVAGADPSQVVRGVRDFDAAGLSGGDVEIRIDWSGVNYKDALATIAGGKVARINPLIPGIDLAGVGVSSSDTSVAPGTAVIAHGYDLGVARHGGYAEYTRVPAGYVVPAPDGLTTRDAMAIGTAGFTAAMSVAALETHGLRPGDGPVVVTGASGGVGSVAVAILAKRGHEVWVATGKADEEPRLRALGAAGVGPREEGTAESGRPRSARRGPPGAWRGPAGPVPSTPSVRRPCRGSSGRFARAPRSRPPATP